MDKEDVESGGVYLARAQDEEYSDRYGVVRVVAVPDDDHPDVMAKTLFTSHDGVLGSGKVTSIDPSMFEEQLWDVQAHARNDDSVPQPDGDR